jgi:hypothetical protein
METTRPAAANIFFLDRDPIIAASMLSDLHTARLPSLMAQLICRAVRTWVMPSIGELYINPRGYIMAGRTHPMCHWIIDRSFARTSDPNTVSHLNLHWALTHLNTMLEEYFMRWGKVHKVALNFEFENKKLIHLLDGRLRSPVELQGRVSHLPPVIVDPSMYPRQDRRDILDGGLDPEIQDVGPQSIWSGVDHTRPFIDWIEITSVYRAYYSTFKAAKCKWTNTEIPVWFREARMGLGEIEICSQKTINGKICIVKEMT